MNKYKLNINEISPNVARAQLPRCTSKKLILTGQLSIK